jgi:hypothetical protein
MDNDEWYLPAANEFESVAAGDSASQLSILNFPLSISHRHSAVDG